MAWECRHSGDLHTCDDGVLVEVLVDGRPAEPGERGEVVVTNLHAYAMPFIRYRIGDVATRAAPCRCGAPFATIGEIRSSLSPAPAEAPTLPLDRIQPSADPGRRMLGA
jgi:phenylacetate-CoA ligase